MVIQEAADNTVGGPTAAARNVLSGNVQGGLAIRGIDAVGDVVQGNWIGDRLYRHSRLSRNSYSGVYVGDWGISGDAASDATIGGTTSGAGNVISANGNWGIWITGNGATGNVVQGEFDPGPTSPARSLWPTHGAASRSTVARLSTRSAGRFRADRDNTISANVGYGVRITGAGTAYNLVQGNTIGTDITGHRRPWAIRRVGTRSITERGEQNTIGGLTTTAGLFHGFDFTSATSPPDLTLQGELSGPPPQQVSGGASAVYHLDLEADGELLAIVHATGFTTRLMLLDSQGRVLVQSDRLSPTDPDPVIDQHLSAGNYSLVVASTLKLCWERTF